MIQQQIGSSHSHNKISENGNSYHLNILIYTTYKQRNVIKTQVTPSIV